MIQSKKVSVIVEMVFDVPYIEGKTKIENEVINLLEEIGEQYSFDSWDFFKDGSVDGSPKICE